MADAVRIAALVLGIQNALEQKLHGAEYPRLLDAGTVFAVHFYKDLISWHIHTSDSQHHCKAPQSETVSSAWKMLFLIGEGAKKYLSVFSCCSGP
ncbi:hypothetical protein CHARACLAT_014216 [Characodon lateralis]|uniref:Uncharacterized protein n=1 Tax=Characodon lateralis TaxID=208331 RepID=A0ABU7D8Z6_9TELE|nr:hypothetical protein [Characodon lateralis]